MVFFVAATIVLLLMTSSLYVFVVAFVRGKEQPWLDEEAIKKTAVGKYYDYMVSASKWLEQHNASDICTSSDDGLLLHGLFVSQENARGTVILAHGYRSTPLLDFGAALPYYYKRGFNLLIPDQRSHGKSQGKLITFGIKESKDMQKWIRYHNEVYGTIPILLFGISMGASTMLYLADKELPINVKGIIADCGFTSPKAIISHVFRSVTHLPGRISIFITNIFTKAFGGFGLQDCDTLRVLQRSRLPVLLVHGTKDGFVPCEMTKCAYSICNSPKEILLVDGADHGTSFLVAPEKYANTVDTFINNYILDTEDKDE